MENPVEKIASELVERFFPKDELIDLLKNVMTSASPEEIVQKIEHQIHKRLAENGDWLERLVQIFGLNYPSKAREFWQHDQLVHETYASCEGRNAALATYRVPHFQPRPFPSVLNCKELAPKLFDVHDVATKDGYVKRLVPSREVDRFRAGNRIAVLESSLFELKVFNRPIHGITNNGWEPYQDGALPMKIIVAQPVFKSPSVGVLSEFVESLASAFPFESEGDLANVLAYILQPMLSHYHPGEFPAYSFQGPPASGKTLLARGLPSRIYRRTGRASVVSSRLHAGEYELQVFLSRYQDAVFVVFEEIKDASNSQLMMLNDLFTSTDVSVRILNRGVTSIPNHFVFALTAVSRGFFDETQRRLVHVKLEQAESDSLKKFFRAWRGRYGEVLAALHEKIQGLNVGAAELDPNEARGPGFAIMAHAVRFVFGREVKFTVEASPHEIYDDIIEMHEANPKKRLGLQAYHSIRSLMEFLREKKDYRKSFSELKSTLEIAFSKGSTKNIAAYRENGYPAESGRRFHLGYVMHGDRKKISVEDLFYSNQSINWTDPADWEEDSSPSNVKSEA